MLANKRFAECRFSSTICELLQDNGQQPLVVHPGPVSGWNLLLLARPRQQSLRFHDGAGRLSASAVVGLILVMDEKNLLVTGGSKKKMFRSWPGRRT